MSANIKQFRSMQMWTVDNDKVYSYNTLVGIWDDSANDWIFTETKYSRTTSKQISTYIYENGGKRDGKRFAELYDEKPVNMHMQLCTPRQWY